MRAILSKIEEDYISKEDIIFMTGLSAISTIALGLIYLL